MEKHDEAMKKRKGRLRYGALFPAVTVLPMLLVLRRYSIRRCGS